MILFKLIAFIFIVGIIAIIVMGVGLWVRVRSAIDQLRGGNAQRTNRKTDNGRGDGVIDQRTPEQSNQKIFGSDEGEYVDFVDEDDDKAQKTSRQQPTYRPHPISQTSTTQKAVLVWRYATFRKWQHTFFGVSDRGFSRASISKHSKGVGREATP